MFFLYKFLHTKLENEKQILYLKILFLVGLFRKLTFIVIMALHIFLANF